jgi:hypothetical protein
MTCRTLAALNRISTLAFVATFWGRFGALGLLGYWGIADRLDRLAVPPAPVPTPPPRSGSWLEQALEHRYGPVRWATYAIVMAHIGELRGWPKWRYAHWRAARAALRWLFKP